MGHSCIVGQIALIEQLADMTRTKVQKPFKSIEVAYVLHLPHIAFNTRLDVGRIENI